MDDLKVDKSDLFKSIGKDLELKQEILELVEKDKQHYDQQSGSTGMADLLSFPANGLETLDSSSADIDILSIQLGRANPDSINQLLNDNIFDDDANQEAIVRKKARPVIRVIDGDLHKPDIQAETLRNRLFGVYHQNIVKTLPSVGRIEVTGHNKFDWLGTGWIVDDDIIVTNRHVCSAFGFQSRRTYQFRRNFLGDEMTARIDFNEEFRFRKPESQSDQNMEFSLKEILYIEPDGGPDLAFLRVVWHDSNKKISPIDLMQDAIDPEAEVAVVGYPARDSRTKIQDEMDKIFGNIYDVKRFAPGRIMKMAEDRGLLVHDCTTLGGNSGSTVFDLSSGRAIALHFKGSEGVGNVGVTAAVVRNRLDHLNTGHTVSGLSGDTVDNAVEESTPEPESLSDRKGYSEKFLGPGLKLPSLSDTLENSVVPVEGRDDGLLNYQNFSLMLHKKRRMPFYSVVNIDGKQLRRIPRGSDAWYFDPRVAREHQSGNELYKSNPLDRGHLVRRLDPAWGRSRATAEQGIEDSFFYTNCVPQHQTLNRTWWLGLEDYILDKLSEESLKVTVFSGPVFDKDDDVYRGVQIPNEFWKVVVVAVPGSGRRRKLSSSCYLLSQRSLIDNLESVFGQHRGYQVELGLIEERAGLTFGSLVDTDVLAQQADEEFVTDHRLNAPVRVKPLMDYDDILLQIADST